MHVAHIHGDVMRKRLNPSLSDRQTPGGLVWTFAGRLESWIGDVTGWQFTSSIVWRGCNVMRLLQIDSAWPRSTPQCFDKFRRIGETWNSIKGVGGMVSFSLFNFAYHRFCIWYGSWNITSFCASFFVAVFFLFPFIPARWWWIMMNIFTGRNSAYRPTTKTNQLFWLLGPIIFWFVLNMG